MPSQLWVLSRIFEALEAGCAVMVESGPPMESETLRTIKEALDFFARNAMYGKHQYEYPCIAIPQETTHVVMVIRTLGTVDVKRMLFNAVESQYGQVIEWRNENEAESHLR